MTANRIAIAWAALAGLVVGVALPAGRASGQNFNVAKQIIKGKLNDAGVQTDQGDKPKPPPPATQPATPVKPAGPAKAADAAAAAAYWPQWRGPARNGISQEAWLPAGKQFGVTRLWQVNVGPGYSVVAVAGKRLFTMGSDKDNELVLCLDADTGKTLWKQGYACPAGQYPGPHGTPTVELGAAPAAPAAGALPPAIEVTDAARVYASGRAGMLTCLNAATGAVVWQTDTATELDAKPLMFGMAGSPLVEGKLVIVPAGKGAAAFDKETGKLAWRADSEAAGYASPVACEITGQRCLLIMAGAELMAVKADDGKVLWRLPWKTQYPNNAADPVLVGTDQVFISANYGVGGALLKMSADKAEIVWQSKLMNNHFAASVSLGDAIVGCDGDFRGNNKKALRCLDVKTGAEKWSAPIGGSPILAGGKLIVLTAEGDLVVADGNAAAWRELGRAKALTGQCWPPPVLAGGRIYCRNAAGDLACWDTK